MLLYCGYNKDNQKTVNKAMVSLKYIFCPKRCLYINSFLKES